MRLSMAFSPLERRRRAAARLALYGSLALIAAAAVLFVTVARRPLDPGKSQEWVGTDFSALPEVRLLQEYVRIDTSAPDGDEVAGAEFLARTLADAGIAAQVERLGEGKANLWAILEGEDPRALVLHNHLDVDPAGDLEHWLYPPFAAHIDGPWLYGRGTFDMKSVAIAQLLAMIDLKRSGEPLRRSVIFLATSSEETGSDLGSRWLLRYRPELAARFWAVLTEGGVVEGRSLEDIKYWGTEFAQKRYVDLLVCGGSRERLADLLSDLRQAGHPVTGLRLVPEVAAFLASYAPTRDDPELRQLLAAPGTVVADLTAFLRLSPYLQSLFRSEVVPISIQEAPGGGYQMLLKFHLLPGVELEEVRHELLPPWMTHGLTLVLDEVETARHGSPLDHPVLQEIGAALRDRHPGVAAGPMFLAWTATDARFFRAAGIPTYGFSPFRVLVSDALHAGRANERIALPAYVEGVGLYREVVHRIIR